MKQVLMTDEQISINEAHTRMGAPRYFRDINVGDLIELIREHHQMDMYTVNEVWAVQIFEKNVCANDQEDCIYETSQEELIDALYEAYIWVMENWWS